MQQDKKESSVADFLNNIDAQDDVFKEEAPIEADKEVEEEVEEKPLPFHKDPKVQRYVEKQIAKALESHKPSEEQRFRKEVQEEINLPSSFIKLVGNDTDEKKQVLKDLSDYFGTLKGEARKEFLEELQEQERQQAEQDNAALEELNTGLETIEDEYGVDLTSDTKTRTAFLSYLKKVSHKNADGEVDQFADIPAAWEEFQERNKPKPASRAKELASRGRTRSGDTTNELPKGRSWKDVDRYFEKLKSNS